jgi:hypothetical protein
MVAGSLIHQTSRVTVDLNTTDTLQWGPEQTLFSTFEYLTNEELLTYGVDTDDRRFLMMGLRQVGNTERIVLDNWLVEMSNSP